MHDKSLSTNLVQSSSVLCCKLKYGLRTDVLLFSLISRGRKTSVSSAVSGFHHSSVQSSNLAKMMLVGTKQCPAENVHWHSLTVDLQPNTHTQHRETHAYTHTHTASLPYPILWVCYYKCFSFYNPRKGTGCRVCVHVYAVYYLPLAWLSDADSVVTFQLSRAGFNQQQTPIIHTQTRTLAFLCMHTHLDCQVRAPFSVNNG